MAVVSFLPRLSIFVAARAPARCLFLCCVVGVAGPAPAAGPAPPAGPALAVVALIVVVVATVSFPASTVLPRRDKPLRPQLAYRSKENDSDSDKPRGNTETSTRQRKKLHEQRVIWLRGCWHETPSRTQAANHIAPDRSLRGNKGAASRCRRY